MKYGTHCKNLPKDLDSEISNENSNFSICQKQLLNLARVLLQDNKVVIFDEATGKVDERYTYKSTPLLQYWAVTELWLWIKEK